MPKLTRRVVKGAVPPAAGYTLIWDSEIRGFGLRVHSSGLRSFFVQYRDKHGESHRMTIGAWGKINPEQARKEAWHIFEDLRSSVRDDHKLHPLAARRARIKAQLVNDLLDRYIAEHVENKNAPTTIAEVRRLVDRHIRPALGRHKAAAVTYDDIQRLHNALKSTPRQADFVLAVCSKAFRLAERWHMRPQHTNPCTGVDRNGSEGRERFLSNSELVRLGEALRLAETVGLPWKVNEHGRKSKHLPKPANRLVICPRVTTAAIELLLFTGCRLSEVLTLRWDQVNLIDGELDLPHTKSGRRQTVVINAPARQVFKQLPGTAFSPWVLPSRSGPDRGLSKTAIEKAWRRIRAAADLDDVHLHDLRHTVGTYAGQSGANAFLVRDLLRHKDLATTGRYVNRDDDPIRTLSDQVGARIAAGLAGSAGADVVEFKREGSGGSL